MIKEFLRWFIKPKPADVERRILHLVQHAWDNIPFYRAKMVEAGITPADIRHLDDYVNKFPRTTSAEYRAYQQTHDSLGLIDARLRVADLVEDRSSGSSGVTISMYRTRHEVEVNQGRALWHLIRAGLRPWHRILAVLPPLQTSTQHSILQSLGIFRRHAVNYTMPLNEIADRIQRSKINVIYGQKSFIRLLADYFLAQGIPAPKLKLLIPGAEKVSEADRKFLQDAFRPDRYAEFYGATETYLIASKSAGDYQADYKAVFFSLADTSPSDDLISGSILVSSLINEAQPVLQMELGDRVLVRNYDRLDELGASIVKIEGRNNDYLVLPNGEKISGATFYASLEYFPFMRQFKVIQESEDNCTVLVKLKDACEDSRRQVEDVLHRLLGGKIHYQAQYVDEIPIDPNGKTKILSSKVNR